MFKIAHIAISVSDLDKSVDFYRKGFGLECTEKYSIESAGLVVCILKRDEVALELFCFENFKALPE